MRFKEFIIENDDKWEEVELDNLHITLSTGERAELILSKTYRIINAGGRRKYAHTLSIEARPIENPDGSLHTFYNEPREDWPLGGTDVDSEDVDRILPRLKEKLERLRVPALVMQEQFYELARAELQRFVNILQIPNLYDGDEETRKRIIKRILKDRK